CGCVVQHAQLRLYRFGDLRAIVTGAAAPQPGEPVEYPAAAVIDQVDAVGGGDDARIALELPVARVGHPQRVELLAGKTGPVGHRANAGRLVPVTGDRLRGLVG